MADFLDALEKLERLGAEDSAAVDNLVHATRRFAEYLEAVLPEDFAFGPADWPRSDSGVFDFGRMFKPSYEMIDGRLHLKYHAGSEDCVLSQDPTRRAALDFAMDISQGVLRLFAEKVLRGTEATSGAIGILRKCTASLF